LRVCISLRAAQRPVFLLRFEGEPSAHLNQMDRSSFLAPSTELSRENFVFAILEVE
jgi:hypothetical protein